MISAFQIHKFNRAWAFSYSKQKNLNIRSASGLYDINFCSALYVSGKKYYQNAIQTNWIFHALFRTDLLSEKRDCTNLKGYILSMWDDNHNQIP